MKNLIYSTIANEKIPVARTTIELTRKALGQE